MRDIPYPRTVSISSREKKLIRDYKCKPMKDFVLSVLAGFIFDGASIPKIFWSLIGSPFTGKYQRAAFIHDALYAGELMPRADCDWLFLIIMKKHGCNWLKRNVIWSAVRLRGGSVWAKHKKEDVEAARKLIRLIGLIKT